MCVIVDGYKMYRVYDSAGISVGSVAGFGNNDALIRAKARGIEGVVVAQWHELYNEYAKCGENIIRKAEITVSLEEMIWEDVANYL